MYEIWAGYPNLWHATPLLYSVTVLGSTKHNEGENNVF